MRGFTAKCSTLALFGALAAAGYSGSALAVPMPAPSLNCLTQAGDQTSWVDDAVEVNATDPDLFDYGFRVCNTSNAFQGERNGEFVIRDWELPWFGDDEVDTFGNLVNNISDITNIVVPVGWNWEIEEIGTPDPDTGWEGVALWQQPGDPFYEFFNDFFGGDPANNPYNDVTHVLHFYTDCTFEGEINQIATCDNPINEGDSLEGFGFTSSFGSTNAPYQASWVFQEVNTGDPQFPLGGGQPNNPILQAAMVPEPGTLAVLGLGLGALAATRRRREEDETS